MFTKDATDLELSRLDEEMKRVEKRLPFWRWALRYFLTGRAYWANQMGEAKGYIVSILLFWSVPAKVWASGVWEYVSTFGSKLLVMLTHTDVT